MRTGTCVFLKTTYIEPALHTHMHRHVCTPRHAAPRFGIICRAEAAQRRMQAEVGRLIAEEEERRRREAEEAARRQREAEEAAAAAAAAAEARAAEDRRRRHPVASDG